MMGKKSPLLRLLAVLMAFSFVAAACGGDDDSSSTSDTTEKAAEAETDSDEGGDDEGDAGGGAIDEDETAKKLEEAAAETTTTVAADEVATLETLEEEWAARRAEIVASLSGFGVEGDVLKGPAGFEIDLSACPADWSDTEGVTDSTLKLAYTVVQSGNLAAYGNLGVGMDVYFNWLNDNGGVGGRQIEFIQKDDEYNSTKTIEAVAELLQADKPFWLSTLGSPNTFAVYDQLNDQCVPQPFVFTGHPAWGDPVNHPWTSGLQMSYSTEAIFWGSWIEQNLADKAPVKVGALVMDNDFGLSYEGAFELYAEESDIIGEVDFQRHDPAAPTVTNEMTTIASGDPDVFISMTAGNPCLLAIEEAANNGLKDRLDEKGGAYFTPSVCKGIAAYMAPAGDGADGYLIFGGGVKDTTDPAYADEPFINFINETLSAAGEDPSVSLNGTGFGQQGWAHVQTLLIANDLDGGLTRTNYMLALRAMSMDHPMLLDGIEFGANGAEDAYFVEGSEVSKFDAGAQSWVQQGGVVDLNGGSPNCAWNRDNNSC